MASSIFIAKRFCGPPDSGNGGYTCGLISQAMHVPADVTIPYVVARDNEIRTTPPAEPSVESALLSEGEQNWPLAVRFVGRHLEPLLTRLAPGADRGGLIGCCLPGIFA